MLIATTCNTSLMPLVSKAATHHVSWWMRRLLSNQMMWHVTTNSNIVFFYHCDSTLARVVAPFAHALVVVLLSLNYVTTKHLRVLYLDLWIVENIIIVVDVLYYFNWLVPLLFLWLWGATSTSMWSMHGIAHWLRRSKVLFMWICEVLLESCQITPLDLIVSHIPLRESVIRRCILFLYNIFGILLYAFFMLDLCLRFTLLINYFTWIIDLFIFDTLWL